MTYKITSIVNGKSVIRSYTKDEMISEFLGMNKSQLESFMNILKISASCLMTDENRELNTIQMECVRIALGK